MTRSLHPCNHRDPLTGVAACDQPAKLYELRTNGYRVWICDDHIFAIDDLFRPVR